MCYGWVLVEYLRDRREFLELGEVCEVVVLLRGSGCVQRCDRRCRCRRKNGRRLDELRLIVALGALEDRRYERHVARRAERAELRQAEPIGEYDDDLPHALAKRWLESSQRRWVRLVAHAEEVEHCCRDVDEPATVVVRRHEPARAETLDECVGHRRTIPPGAMWRAPSRGVCVSCSRLPAHARAWPRPRSAPSRPCRRRHTRRRDPGEIRVGQASRG